MKAYPLLFFFVSLSLPACKSITSNTSNAWVQQEWATKDPTVPQADEYDIRLTMVFKKDKLSLYNSKHQYPQYTGYRIEGKSLVLLRNDAFKNDQKFQPVFSIESINREKMVLEARNWAAVYISSVLSSLWLDTTESEFVSTDETGLSYGGMLQTQLELTAVK